MERIILLLLATPMIAFTQNLVPNGSFECGEDFCGAFQYDQLQVFFLHSCEWSTPSTGTSDIFSTKLPNTCYNGSPGVDAPLPHSGNRFGGIYTYDVQTQYSEYPAYREYLQVKLTETLIPGEKYCTGMYVSLSKSYLYASNNLGISINTFPTYPYFYDQFNYAPLYFTPQLLIDDVIKDTTQWVKVDGIFIATDTAQYLTIGNFFDNSNTRVEKTSSESLPHYAYYFIDDVYVEKLPYDSFTITGPTTLCEGQSIELTATVGVDQIEWTTLEDTITILKVGEKFSVTPEASTSYRVRAKGCNKTVTDTVSIKVNPLPVVNLGSDTTLCKGEKHLLDAGKDFISYRWQDETTKRDLQVAEAGTYWVEVSDRFDCLGQDEIKIDFDDVPDIDIGKDTLVCEGFYRLLAGGPENSYLWFNGLTENTFLPASAGTYWVTAKNHCGEKADTIKIYARQDIFIPNVITANNDRANDKFVLGIQEENSEVDTSVDINASLQIFNRWGQQIFYSNRYKNNWPELNAEIDTGEYYYQVFVPGCRDYKGWVHVIH